MGVFRRVAVALAAVVGFSTVAVPMAGASAGTVPGLLSSASFTASSTGATSMTSGVITIMWNPPVDNGGSSIVRYNVVLTRHSDNATIGTCQVDMPADLVCTFPDLVTGIGYDASITSTNATGTSDPSVNDHLLTPIGVPDHPNAITVTPGDNKFVITWTPPTNNGGATVTGYTVNVYDPSNYPNDLGVPQLLCEIKTLPAPLTCTLDGGAVKPTPLTLSGKDWIIGVTAENSEGLGIEAFAAPDAGTVSTVLNGGKTSAAVSWTNNPAVLDGSEPSIAYVTLYDENGFVATDADGNPLTCTSQGGTSCTITGLDPTVTYTTKVIYGCFTLLKGAPPIQPTKPVGTSDQDSQVPVTWTAAGTTVGVNYFVQAYDKNGNKVGTGDINNPGAGSCVSTHPVTNCIVPGLTNGEPYTFVVTPYSKDKKVKGVPSLISDPAIPARPPSVPQNVKQIAKNGTIDVTWDASLDNGGAEIDKYVVEVTDPKGNVVGTCTVVVPDPFSCSIGNGLLGTSTKYTVSVKAHNRINYGPPALVTNVIPVLALTNTAGYKSMVVAVGDDGVIFRSKDKGNTYAPDDSGTHENLRSVICPTPTRCLTVGDNGTIKYWDGPMTDVVQTWTPAANPNTSANLKSVACGPMSTICLTVGDGGTVMLSDSTDDTWTQIAGAPMVDYKQVVCPNNQDCLIIGTGGTLLKISAPFTTFQPLTTKPVTTDDLNAIRCPNPKYCLAVGNNGKVISASAPWDNTTKASKWKQITLVVGHDLRGIACPAQTKICVTVGTGGIFAATTTSNVLVTKSWRLARTRFTYDLDKVRCRSKVDCVAVSAAHLTTATWSTIKKKWSVKQIT